MKRVPALTHGCKLLRLGSQAAFAQTAVAQRANPRLFDDELAAGILRQASYHQPPASS